ncbi:hypothetical protein HZA44_01505 [Candidatus Peregrinibacteria bacterium]|nr:hypothetical protein [Candidatus Peregrinibacteria bacterium]
MGLIDQIKGGFEGLNKPPELDKTKKALEELKGQINAAQIDVALPKLRESFMKDLDELGMVDEKKRAEYWGQVETVVRTEALKETPEFKNLNAFIDNPQNLAGLPELIKEKDPAKTVNGWFDKLPGGSLLKGGLAAMLLNWANDMKKDGKDSFFGTQLKKLANWLGSEKKDDKTEAKEAEKTLADSLVKKFSDKGLILEASGATAGIADLAKDDIKDDKLTKLVDTALEANGLLTKLYAAIKPKESLDQKFKFKLTDIRLQKNFSEEQVGTLVSALKNDKDSPYQVAEGLDGARKLLDAALAMKDGKLNEALATFKKPEKALEKKES